LDLRKGESGLAELVELGKIGAGLDDVNLTDLARAAEVRYLTKWGWALACLLSVPSAASCT
jgi:hypothetical protein